VLVAVVFFFFTAPAGVFAQKIRVATLYIGSSMLPLWIAFEQFVDHTLLQEARLQQEKNK
jgi:hypothetical protein